MSSYPPAVYDETRDGVKASAAVVVPLLIKAFGPSSVLDVGCGEGWWLKEFADRGVEAAGIDGPHVTPPAGSFTAQNLESPLRPGSYDLVLCLEVAEHLSPGRAESFVAELCGLAPTIVFSAAIPGQGGAGHLNEQWPQTWAALFGKHGYRGTGALRQAIWSDSRVQPWYRQNLLVFGDHAQLPEEPVVPLVHPDIWGWYRP